MGVREIDRFLDQWQMDARDLHRPFQMHHSFSVAIYAIPGSMAGVVVVCARPSRAMPSLWAAAMYLRTVILGKAGAHRDLPRARGGAGCSPPGKRLCVALRATGNGLATLPDCI